MPLDDDADDDVGSFDPPLPPDDRLWRHPSEMATFGRPGAAPARAPGSEPRTPVWPVATAAGLVGAALATAVMVVTGGLSTNVVEHSVVEKVAVTPMVSSPMVRGERGVVAVAQRLAPAVARLVLTGPAGTATGSAVIFRDDGLLLTSAHLLDGATSIDAILDDGRHFEGRLVGVDRPTDVAVVEIDADRLSVAVLGSSANLEVGSPTVAIGCATAEGRAPSVSTGVISAIDRRLDDAGSGESLHGLIQTDAPIEAGGAGGALVDANGAVIGIIAPLGSGRADGFGFATPIDLARRVAEQIVTSGHVIHGWLGIEGDDLPAELAQAMAIAGGARIRGVQRDSPAARAGLSLDDVITEIDDAAIDSASGLVVTMRDHQPGDEVTVGYWRDGGHHEAAVTIGRRLQGP